MSKVKKAVSAHHEPRRELFSLMKRWVAVEPAS